MRKGLWADLSSADFIPARPDYVRRGSYWYLERRLTVAQRWPPKSPSDPYSSWQLESCPPSGEHTPRPARPSSTTSEGPPVESHSFQDENSRVWPCLLHSSHPGLCARVVLSENLSTRDLRSTTTFRGSLSCLLG